MLIRLFYFTLTPNVISSEQKNCEGKEAIALLFLNTRWIDGRFLNFAQRLDLCILQWNRSRSSLRAGSHLLLRIVRKEAGFYIISTCWLICTIRCDISRTYLCVPYTHFYTFFFCCRHYRYGLVCVIYGQPTCFSLLLPYHPPPIFPNLIRHYRDVQYIIIGWKIVYRQHQSFWMPSSIFFSKSVSIFLLVFIFYTNW